MPDKLIEPLESLFGQYPWPGTKEQMKIKRVAVAVGGYGIALALRDWEKNLNNEVPLSERVSLFRAALDAYMFFYTLGHSHTDEDLYFFKAQTAMRVYSAKLNKEITLDVPLDIPAVTP